MSFLRISKQILAYSNWMNKARSKIENIILKDSGNRNFKYYTLLQSNSYYQMYYQNVLRGKNLTFQQLDQNQKKQFNGMVQDILNNLQERISDITGQLNEKTWILKNYINETYIPQEDDEKYEQVLTLFNHYKPRKQMTKKDIKQYRDYSQLYDAVSKFLTMQNVYQFAKSQCKLICTAGSFSCFRVDSFQQGKILFNQTGWCVKARGYFDNYGAPYYLVFSGQKRVALIHLDSAQCKDVSDNTISPDSVSNDFIKMLGVLFQSQNNSQFLIDNDFEGYQSYYIDNCIDQIDSFVDILNQVIYNQDFQHIYWIIRGLNDKGKLFTLLQQNSSFKEELQGVLKAGETDDRQFQQVIEYLVAQQVKLQYPTSAMYIIANDDSVTMWQKLWKNNQTEEIDYNYDQLVLSTYSILKHELENGYQLSRFDVEQAKYVLEDFTKQIDSVEGAKKFLSMFYYDTSEQLEELLEYIFDYLDITEQQKEYLEEYKDAYIKKEAFDSYPTLPGLEEYMK